jgi:hypothetical protein
MHYLRRILALHTTSINNNCSTAISLGHYITRCSLPRLITALSSSNSISMLRSKFKCVLFIARHTLRSRQRQELRMIPLRFTFYLKSRPQALLPRVLELSIHESSHYWMSHELRYLYSRTSNKENRQIILQQYDNYFMVNKPCVEDVSSQCTLTLSLLFNARVT